MRGGTQEKEAMNVSDKFRPTEATQDRHARYTSGNEES